MIIAKRQKIGGNYSEYYYLYNVIKDETSEYYKDTVLKSNIIADEVSDDPTESFEVKFDAVGSYIVNKEGKEFNTGFSPKEIKRYFY